MHPSSLVETESVGGPPSLMLELEAGKGKKAVPVPVTVCTLAAEHVTLEVNTPWIRLPREDLHGCKGRLMLPAQLGQAPRGLEGTVTSLTPPAAGRLKPRLGWKLAGAALEDRQLLENLVIYAAPDMKYLWTQWDQAQSGPAALPYRHAYLGAGVIILAGFILTWLNLPYGARVGNLLMFIGGLTGAACSLKSLRLRKLSRRGH